MVGSAARFRGHAITVRPATAEDLPALLALHAEIGRGPAARVRRSNGHRELPDEGGLAERYRGALDAPGSRLLVASLGTEPVGVALLLVTQAPASVDDGPYVHVVHLVVAARARRRGVGRALLGEALAIADEYGIEAVAVGVRPGDREANRYFARLGFAPVAVRRLAPVSALRRTLHPASAAAPRGPATASPALRRRLRTSRHPAALQPRDPAGT